MKVYDTGTQKTHYFKSVDEYVKWVREYDDRIRKQKRRSAMVDLKDHPLRDNHDDYDEHPK